MPFARVIKDVGMPAITVVALLTTASTVVFGQTISTTVGGSASQSCGTSQLDSRNLTLTPDPTGVPNIAFVMVGPSDCQDYTNAVYATTSASASGWASATKGKVQSYAEAQTKGVRADAAASMYSAITRTVVLEPPAGYTGSAVTAGIISTYATGVNGNGTGGGAVILTVTSVNDNLLAFPLTASHVFHSGDAPSYGLLTTDDITLLACPCSVTYTVSAAAGASTLPGQYAFAIAKDPVYLNLPPGWTSTAAATPACGGELDTPGASLSGGGDQGAVNLSVGEGCAWTASSDSNWLNISASAGTGSQKIRYTADPNSTGVPRNGILTIAGNNFLVEQADEACGINLSTQNVNVDVAGLAGALNVSTASNCAWTASSSAEWLGVLPAVPDGNGEADFLATPNVGTLPRTGSATIAGRSIQFVQGSPKPVQVFQDVPFAHPFFNYIWLMSEYTITHGCGVATYCPDDPVTRGEMAVFIIRALMGDSFAYQQTPYFTDVPASHPFFAYVQKMKELGITSGCSATTYCTDDPVTRGQMAVFIVRARLGLAAGDLFAFPSNPYFTDVSTGEPFFPFIQKLKDLGVTAGCTATTYCENDPTTRGQMAVFIVRGLLTP
jgi:hypothetical protein